jgi:hypothetical protein
MFEVGERVYVSAYTPYYAVVERVGRPGTWYPGGATEIMVKPDDKRPAREVNSRDLSKVHAS